MLAHARSTRNLSNFPDNVKKGEKSFRLVRFESPNKIKWKVLRPSWDLKIYSIFIEENCLISRPIDLNVNSKLYEHFEVVQKPSRIRQPNRSNLWQISYIMWIESRSGEKENLVSSVGVGRAECEKCESSELKMSSRPQDEHAKWWIFSRKSVRTLQRFHLYSWRFSAILIEVNFARQNWISRGPVRWINCHEWNIFRRKLRLDCFKVCSWVWHASSISMSRA